MAKMKKGQEGFGKRGIKDKKTGNIIRTDHSNMSDVFNDVMTSLGLNKGKQQKQMRDKQIKEAGG